MWEISENLHRLDLTKEQRDEHIRRYAELLEARREADKIIVSQNAEQLPVRPVGRPKSIVTEISETTGLSRDTVSRALNPKPAPEPKSPLPDYDVVTVQFNALMAAWNRAGPEARERLVVLSPRSMRCGHHGGIGMTLIYDGEHVTNPGTMGVNAKTLNEDGETVVVETTEEAIEDYGWEKIISVASQKYDNGNLTSEGSPPIVRVTSGDCADG